MKRSVRIGLVLTAMLAVLVPVCLAGAAEKESLSELDFTVPSGVSVGSVDISGMTGAEAKEAIQEYVDIVSQKTVTFTIGDNREVYTVSDFGCTWSNEAAITQALDKMDEGSLLSRYKAYKDVTVGIAKQEIAFAFDTEKMEACMQELAERYNTEPVNAELTYEGGVFTVSESVDGIVLDTEQAQEALLKAINNWEGDSIELEVEYVFSAAEVNSDMYDGFGALLGTCTTDYYQNNTIRNMNVEIAAEHMNGHMFMPEEEISCLELMGPFSEADGFGLAPSYVGGKQQDTIAGGICQVATTLYGAYLQSEMQILYRRNHSYSVSYVEPSMDATVFPDSGLDLEAKNNTGSPIYIEAYTKDGKITVNIYGVEYRPANRTIEYRSIITSQQEELEADDQADSSMKPGTVTYLNEAHVAMTSQLYKDVYVDGALTESILINSDTYKAMAATRRYGAPVDDEGTAYYVRDDGYVVALEDKDNPDAETYRLNPDGTWLDDPLEDEKKDDGKDDDKKTEESGKETTSSDEAANATQGTESTENTGSSESSKEESSSSSETPPEHQDSAEDDPAESSPSLEE